jgi:SSS family solute:Na+ symporter
MQAIDFAIFIIYMVLVFLVGAYFFRKNKTDEDYYVGGRNMSPYHIGLSVVATDVGGGFSIGLGGLGYMIGLSGSWLLFTGLIGAWLSAVLIIPKLKKVDVANRMLSYPDFLRFKYNDKVALIAAIISGIGYMGFTGGQILAGAKLSAATLFKDIPIDMDPMLFSLIIIAGVILIYTVLGGLKAVVYTDTIQWIILLVGLIFFAIPFTLIEVGGFSGLSAALPDGFLTLTNVEWIDIINWFITIVPIWFIAMTLYQRMFACKDEKDAKKAWYIAGIFEWPIMAFTGVFLGMASRVFFPEVESEMGLPMLLHDILPTVIKGIVVAAYFSAIMSTADSCLIASSGNFVNDIIGKYFFKTKDDKKLIRLSQIATLVIGIITILIAVSFQTVLDIILQTYSFMVAGLLVPTIIAYYGKERHLMPAAAMGSMLGGGSVALFLILSNIEMPLGLHPSFYGILTSAVIFIIIYLIQSKRSKNV